MVDESIFECPTCDRAFETKRGRSVHHTSVHGVRLPNRTCERCSEPFRSDYEKKYCSERCRTRAVSYKGSSNPNFRNAKERSACRICNTTFEYYPSSKDGIYCPECVRSENWQEHPTLCGSEHPGWNGGKRTVTCDVCDETVERYPSNVGDVVTCSESCRGRWLSTAFSGVNHPNWAGGGNESYGTGWNEVRTTALERDGYACVHCGVSKEALGRNPDVHHLVPVRAFDESPDHELTDAHSLDNVVSLCIPCHRKAEFGKIDPESLRAAAGLSEAESSGLPAPD